MQVISFPISLCEDLDRVNRNFLWGSTESHRRVHLIGWDKVSVPKDQGGLGIRKTQDMNKILLAKNYAGQKDLENV